MGPFLELGRDHLLGGARRSGADRLARESLDGDYHHNPTGDRYIGNNLLRLPAQTYPQCGSAPFAPGIHAHKLARRTRDLDGLFSILYRLANGLDGWRGCQIVDGPAVGHTLIRRGSVFMGDGWDIYLDRLGSDRLATMAKYNPDWRPIPRLLANDSVSDLAGCFPLLKRFQCILISSWHF